MDVDIRRDRHPGRLAYTLRGPEGAVARDMRRRANRVQAAARRFVGVDSGHLRSKIEVRPARSPRGGGVGYQVGAWGVPYARFHHDGNFHKQGEFIRPVRARALRFAIGGRVIFARKVKSYRGSKFLTRAVPFARD